jgi:hypothetical protein
MKSATVALFLILVSCLPINSQEKQRDIPLFSAENLEFSALKPSFYLIRQEYVLSDKDGKSRTRGGNEYYGKAYTIGIIDEDTRLWFPNYIRRPWEIDETVDKQLINNSEPQCSLFCIKGYSDQDYFRTKIPGTDEINLLSFILCGKSGIPPEDSLQHDGTLIVFYSSAASPDDFTAISHTLMFLNDITWTPDGISNIQELYYGNNKILGGALFSRYVIPGAITWKLAGLYIPFQGKWVIKSITNQ